MCHQGQSQNLWFWWLDILPPARNLRTDSRFALLFQDCLLTKIDEKLPFTGHVSGTFQQFYFVERFLAAGYLMGTQEVIISNPKRDAVDSTILCTIAAGNAVGFLESTVQTLDELLERAEFF